MKRFRITAALLFLSISLTAGEDTAFREKEIGFIKELYRNGRYFDCIGETEKLVLTGKTPAVDYFIYTNYFLAGQYATVIGNYIPVNTPDEAGSRSLMLLSGAYLKKGMYEKSYQTLKGVEYGKPGEKNNFTIFLRRIEPLVLSAETELIDYEIRRSEIVLKDSYDFIRLREELVSYSREGIKSRVWAPVMSAVVPGLGQCYSGYPMEGLISLLSVAATAAGGYYMKDTGRKGFSVTLFCFSGLFYAGNIYGAYNSASSANREAAQNRYRSITNQFGVYNPADYIRFEDLFR